MSAKKLLQRVVAPDAVYDRKDSKRKIAANLHEYTFGITSDPLTQFAIVFSALIHDVDHQGVSNGKSRYVVMSIIISMFCDIPPPSTKMSAL